MAPPESHRIVIVGAGPAGLKAAETLAAAGISCLILDEAERPGGQVYRQPAGGLDRSARALYGFEAAKAARIHGIVEKSRPLIEYWPGTSVWACGEGRLDIVRAGRAETVRWTHLVLATGATDRIIPFPGWTEPGVFTLGGSQVMLKAQGVAIGARPLFVGTGPLLYLVAYQYRMAGIAVAGVLDTSGWKRAFRATRGLLSGGTTFAKGLCYVAALRVRGVPIHRGITPEGAIGAQEGGIRGFAWKDARGRRHETACDAIGTGYGLRSETQLAALAGAELRFEPRQRQWLPTTDDRGRLPGRRVYLAGDGARIDGADLAELSGARAGRDILGELGLAGQDEAIARINARIARAQGFRDALDREAFPFPVALAQAVPDEVVICRCEGVTAGELRASVQGLGAREINRSKAFSRLGMGRCQGRICGPCGAEIIAAASGADSVETVGALRPQDPIKPVSLSALAGVEAHAG